MKNIELIQYLDKFPDDAEVSLLLANPKERKFYEHSGIGGITDMGYPVLVVEIIETFDMDEEMVNACEKDEREDKQ
jgi:hypothetical protein